VKKDHNSPKKGLTGFCPIKTRSNKTLIEASIPTIESVILMAWLELITFHTWVSLKNENP
jgi:hypothetical protein